MIEKKYLRYYINYYIFDNTLSFEPPISYKVFLDDNVLTFENWSYDFEPPSLTDLEQFNYNDVIYLRFFKFYGLRP